MHTIKHEIETLPTRDAYVLHPNIAEMSGGWSGLANGLTEETNQLLQGNALRPAIKWVGASDRSKKTANWGREVVSVEV